MHNRLNRFKNNLGRTRMALVALIIGLVSMGSLMMVESSAMPQKKMAQEIAKPSAKGNRILGIKVNNGEDGDFDKIFKESLEMGNETQVLPLDWNELETAPGKFEPKINFLAIANIYYPAYRVPIHLSIRPIHTSQKVVPVDLQDKPIDDPQTIQRFKNLIDWVATQIPKVKLVSMVIGSEIDLTMWGDAQRWEEWINFHAAVAPYARKKFPGTLISCETSYTAFVGYDLEHVRKLHQHSDVIGVSYYPMKKKLKGVKSPASVHADFQTVVNAIPGKPIIYYQIGYPSSADLGSTPELQAEFITEAFRAWDKNASRILMLNFQWMHETPKHGLDYYAQYYQYDTPAFRAFLGSLGFQSWSGEPKPAWAVLKKEAKVRRFGVRRRSPKVQIK